MKEKGAPEAAPPEPRNQGLLLDLFRVVLHGVIQHFLGRQVAHEHHLDIGLQFLFKGSLALELADHVDIRGVRAGQGGVGFVLGVGGVLGEGGR